MQLRSRPEVRTIPQVATSPVLVPGRTRTHMESHNRRVVFIWAYEQCFREVLIRINSS